jgi:lipoprotein-releasing system permease protein
MAFLAVALCVFMVIVVMTVMRGLVTDFRQKNHSFVGDCIVGTESLVGFAYYEDFMKVLENRDFVESVSPLIKSYGLIAPKDSEQSLGVEIMGIDPARHSRTTGFGETLYYRSKDAAKAFEPTYDPNLPGFVVGVDVWLLRDARGGYSHTEEPYDVELLVTCFPLTPKGALQKGGTGMVNTKSFHYSDTSHSGLARVDGSVLYLPFEQAQLLCGMSGAEKRVSRLHIKFRPGIGLQAGCKTAGSLWGQFVEEKKDESLSYLLETVTVQSWKAYRRPFIAAMEKEHTMMIVMFTLVGVTTVFIIFVVFYMIVSHKSKDIGILKSVGVSNVDLVRLYLLFAALVGVLGSCFGLLGGWLFLLRINQIEGWLFERFGFQLWDRTIYAIGAIPYRIDLNVMAATVVSAMAACLIGALVPSWQAVRLRPVETLQVGRL